jgi:hypothetical protein
MNFGLFRVREKEDNTKVNHKENGIAYLKKNERYFRMKTDSRMEGIRLASALRRMLTQKR